MPHAGVSTASLLIPAIRWDPARGYERERAAIERALSLGVGGFLLRGGEQEAVRQLTRELRLRSRLPLLIAADLERGTGQQFLGATGLPPAAAIAALDDVDAVRRAARLTAREARTLGVNWDFAPVCDLDLTAGNPVIGTRSFGADPQRVAFLVSEWITACQGEGVLACAKHFPGHGRTTVDSHVALPTVTASRGELLDVDVAPFAAAVRAGVASMMTAHVAYPALDASGVPATLSREIQQWLLRQELRFDGLIVTDALGMAGITGSRGETDAALQALLAGCDLLLAPTDLESTCRALDAALADRRLDASRVQNAERRRLKWAQWASPPNEYRRPSSTDIAWGAQLADRVIRVMRGDPRPPNGGIDLLLVEDDAGRRGAAGARDPLVAALAGRGRDVRCVDGTSEPSGRPLVLALFGDGAARDGACRYRDATVHQVEEVTRRVPETLVVQFGHPRLTSEIPSAQFVICAWSGDPAMQQAAARWLCR